MICSPPDTRPPDQLSDYWFDEASAQRAVRFCAEYLVHVKGRWAGKPFVLLPWQEQLVRDVFGWKRRDDNMRRYRTVYLETPRKSGKSTLAGMIALYLLLADGEWGAEVYSAAADRAQAAIVFDTAKQMVEVSPRLRERVEVYRNAIVVPATMSAYRVLSADVPTKHGINAHGIIFDELHAQPNRELWDVLTTSVGAREQPLVVAITTAGYDQASIWWQIHQYACRVRDGLVDDPTFYVAIYAADEHEQWDDPQTWRKANPSLGVTVAEEFYEQESRKAKEMPSYENTFRRLYLNQPTQQHSRWLSLDLWDENAGVVIEEELRGRTCYGALDLGAVSDLTAWVLLFPHDDDPETVDVLARFWCPQARLHDNQNRYRDQYQRWAREGWLQTTPGEATDYAFVKRQILEDAERFRIVDLGVDRLFQAHQLAGELMDEGLAVVGIGQGFLSMAAPMKELERRLLARKIRHGGNPLLRWMADNVTVKQDPAGNLKPDKASSQGKIDGIVALAMALDRAMRHDNQPKRSVYEAGRLKVI